MASVARWQARYSAARLLGDGIRLRATVDAPNLNRALFVDARNLAIDSIRTANWQAVVTKATTADNLWFRTRIESSTRETTTAVVNPLFPAYIRGGDELDVFMHRGTGWRIEEYDAEINDAIAQLGRDHAQEANAVVVAPYDPYAATIPIPDDWIGVYAIEYQFGNGSWQETNEGFDLDRANRLIRVDRNDAFLLRDRPLRLWGKKPWPPLTEDANTTNVPLGYLRYSVASMLLQSGSHRQVEREVENKSLYWAQRAQEFLGQVGTRRRSNIVWVD